MSGQATFPRERLSTQLAWKTLGAEGRRQVGVPFHVLFVASPVGERSAAAVAEKWFFTRMYTLVPIQSVLPAEPPSAVPALEPFFNVVEPRVDQQVTGSFERLSADLALVRTLVHVCP